MDSVRPAAVAGSFYPDSPRELEELLDEMLAAARLQTGRPKALVVPHAGYVYSGPVAASAYAQLRAPLPTRVVLLGPSHFVPLRGFALPGDATMATPLGQVPIEDAAHLPLVSVSRSAHAREHSLEVQVPFLQRRLPTFSLVPLVVGQASAEEAAAVLDALWGGDETLVVISTDLSHYLPYELARHSDAHTARAILALDPAIAPEQACGGVGLRGLLTTARRRGLVPRQLDLRNSGDTAGDPARVVGYGAFAFYEEVGP